MFVILPEHISSLICVKTIDIYKNNEDSRETHRDTKLIDSRAIGQDFFKKTLLQINNIAVSLYGKDTYIEMAQIVEWPNGSNQPPHCDLARGGTKSTSITYLNDDFEGGETYFTQQDLIIKPKRGKTVFFDGKKFEHGVQKITKGIRYTLAVWYSKNIYDCVI
tara:strand:- start:70 stop:558 length:489 start_codon:yes stop_codon:yes gene_type:complete